MQVADGHVGHEGHDWNLTVMVKRMRVLHLDFLYAFVFVTYKSGYPFRHTSCGWAGYYP